MKSRIVALLAVLAIGLVGCETAGSTGPGLSWTITGPGSQLSPAAARQAFATFLCRFPERREHTQCACRKAAYDPTPWI